MDLISDNFISYTEAFAIKQEKLLDEDLSSKSLLSGASESTSICTISIPPTLQNFLNSTDFTPEESIAGGNEKQLVRRKHQPFIISNPRCVVKTKKEEPAQSLQLKFEDDEKILAKSKRILKRAKAKQRIQLKQEALSMSSPNSSKNPCDLLNDSSLDEKSKRKLIQMIRNRISAQNSRDRKKNYLQNLEQVKNKLAEDNLKLLNDKNQLLKEVKRLEEFQAQLRRENELIKRFSGACWAIDQQEEIEDRNGGDVDLQHFGKNVEELSSLITSKFPNCNKSLFNNIFTFATMISLTILPTITQQGNLSTLEDPSNLAETEKLVNETLWKIASRVQNEKPNSPLIESLNSLFSSRNNNSSSCKSLFASLLQTERTRSHSSDLIKVEESEHLNMNGFHQSSRQLACKEERNREYLAECQQNEEQGLNLFPTSAFKSFHEDQKALNHHSDIGDMDSFKDSHIPTSEFFSLFNPSQCPATGTDESSTPKASPGKKDTDIVELLFSALMNPQVLQNLNK